jgi:hypothetical protein
VQLRLLPAAAAAAACGPAARSEPEGPGLRGGNTGHWPPFAAVRPPPPGPGLGPVRSWAGRWAVGWAWSGGSNAQQLGPWPLATGPLGSFPVSGVRWPVAPTGTGAGSSAPPPCRRRLAAGGRGLRPRVFPAHRPGAWAAAPSTCPGTGCVSPSFGKASSDRRRFPLHAHFHSGQVLCRFRLALQRKSGPRIALPAHRLYYPVDMWPRSTTRGFCGDLRGAP